MSIYAYIFMWQFMAKPGKGGRGVGFMLHNPLKLSHKNYGV